MSLPLPETTYALASPGGRWHEEYVLNESGYSTDQMQAYGQACREQALEEAAQAAIDACGFNGATVQLEAHIRTAIKELK